MRRADRRWIGLSALGLMLSLATAGASGPRWVAGPPYFTAAAGTPVVWYTTQPLYFTDPGDLSASVNHAAADAMVAAAAGVWNVPTSTMVLAQGGTLTEHVSAANAYLSSDGPVFPADVQANNYAAIQIAVIYDSDGSVTDMLLGEGRGVPAECRDRERRLDCARGVHPARDPGAERTLHRACAGAADADAVPVGAGIRTSAGAGLVADQRQRLYRNAAADQQPGAALADPASH
jgi:hypothetical protein